MPRIAQIIPSERDYWAVLMAAALSDLTPLACSYGAVSDPDGLLIGPIHAANDLRFEQVIYLDDHFHYRLNTTHPIGYMAAHVAAYMSVAQLLAD